MYNEESYELMALAHDTKGKNKRKEIYKTIIDNDPDFIDAHLQLAILEAKNPYDKLKRVDEVLLHATELLMEEDAFDDDNIGHFYGMIETRPFMRVSYERLSSLKDLGLLQEALFYGHQILILNESDNMGVRFEVFALMCLLQPIEACLAFASNYDADCLEFKVGFCIKYFNEQEPELAKEMLVEIIEMVPDFNSYLVSSWREQNIADTFIIYSEEHIYQIAHQYQGQISFDFVDWCLDNDPRLS